MRANYVARSIESRGFKEYQTHSGRWRTLYKLSIISKAGEVKRQDSLERNIKTLNDGIKV